MNTARALAYLGYSHQHVRRLVKAGVDYRDALANAGPNEVVQEPRRYLLVCHGVRFISGRLVLSGCGYRVALVLLCVGRL